MARDRRFYERLSDHELAVQAMTHGLDDIMALVIAERFVKHAHRRDPGHIHFAPKGTS